MAKHNLRGLHIGGQFLPDAFRFLCHIFIRDTGVRQNFQLDRRLSVDDAFGAQAVTDQPQQTTTETTASESEANVNSDNILPDDGLNWSPLVPVK